VIADGHLSVRDVGQLDPHVVAALERQRLRGVVAVVGGVHDAEFECSVAVIADAAAGFPRYALG